MMAEWDFLEREEWQDAVKAAAHQAARKWEVDTLDVHQELVLWLAENPDKFDKERPNGIMVYWRALDCARRLHGRQFPLLTEGELDRDWTN